MPERLTSLDALRGFTILAMVIVNSPGTWDSVYPPLLHASWHGMTMTDLIFPFFLFIVGVSITLAYTKRIKKGVLKSHMYKKISSRTLKIFVLGLFLWLWPNFDFGNLRYAGVLQRIAIVFLVCSVLFLNTNWKKQAIIASILLVGYWLLMSVVPVPIDSVIQSALETGTIERSGGRMIAIGELTQVSSNYIAPNVKPGVNFAAWFDRQFLPGYFWERTWDPEGLLSTLPAIVTGIIGMLTGTLIKQVKDSYKKLTWIFFFGFALFIVGYMWSWVFPFNKNVWTSSYTLSSGGLAAMFLAASMLIVDLLNYKSWTKPGIVYGANAITCYVLSGILLTIFYNDIFFGYALNSLFVNGLVDLGAPAKLASLMYAIIYAGIIYLPAYWLYSRKIFIKV